LRGIAVPTEHGGWGLTLEPVLLGLLVAPSWAGIALGVAALFAFLTRTPLKLSIGDRRRTRHLPRTALADRLAALYGIVAVGAIVPAALLADGPFWIPLLVAFPFVAVQAWYDARSRSRELPAELAGPLGIGTIAPAIALAAGAGWKLALGLWLVMALRVVASVVLVRAQLRRTKNQPYRSWPVHAVDIMAAGIGVGTAAAGLLPRPAAAVLALLPLIGWWELWRPPVRAVVVGVHQTILGLAIVILAAAGFGIGG
jgi:hypothetical protein